MAAIWMSVSLGFLPAFAFGTLRNGMLMMVLCDRWGRVYDVWISFGSVHEALYKAKELGRNRHSWTYGG